MQNNETKKISTTKRTLVTTTLLSAPSRFHASSPPLASPAGHHAAREHRIYLLCLRACSLLVAPLDSIHSPVTAKGATRNSPPGQWSRSACRPRAQARRPVPFAVQRIALESDFFYRRFAEIQASVETFRAHDNGWRHLNR